MKSDVAKRETNGNWTAKREHSKSFCYLNKWLKMHPKGQQTLKKCGCYKFCKNQNCTDNCCIRSDETGYPRFNFDPQ